MNVASRPVSPGRTRTCPHCKAEILDSLTICPGCLHHLRFDSEAAKRQVAATSALKVEGVIRHPPLEDPWEYFVVIAVRNDRGEEVTRQVVNVGALHGNDERTFSLSVEVLPSVAKATGPSTEASGKHAALTAPPGAASGAATKGAGTNAAPSVSPPGKAPPAAATATPQTVKATPLTGHQPPGPASPYVLKPPVPGGPKPPRKS